MCEDCVKLQKQIDQFQRFLAQPIDELTKGRLKMAVEEMHLKIAGNHPQAR